MKALNGCKPKILNLWTNNSYLNYNSKN